MLPFIEGILKGMHIIGYKSGFVYYQAGNKTNWLMDEYRVNRNYILNWDKMEKWVICKIFTMEMLMKEESIHQMISVYLMMSSNNPIPRILMNSMNPADSRHQFGNLAAESHILLQGH